MPFLEFESSAAKGSSSKKPLKLFLVAGVLVGALTLGSTFAANINLNDDSPVEFGQGFVTTTACDPDGITVTPTSSFVNEEGGGDHKLAFIKISGIDSREGACDGKTFRIKAYGVGDSPLDLFRYKITEDEENVIDRQELENKVHNSIEVNNIGGVFTWASGGTDGDDAINEPDTSLQQTAVTLKLVSVVPNPIIISRTPLASSEDVMRITVETIDTTCLQGANCEVGDVGPGGGIVFYAADEGTDFTCGPMYELRCRYLEAAPNNWYQGGPDPTRTWSTGANQSIWVEGTDDISIGSGYRNSIDIESQNGNGVDNSAAVFAREYGGGGKSDWYLPSQDELDRLLREKLTVGGFLLDSFYWSSSEFTSADASAISAFMYSWGVYPKSDLRYVRPIRAF
jgi:hypothetical protein